MIVNSKEIEVAKAEPDASSMIETFRAIGYSLETAIADIIDNSVSAYATNVWLDYKWEGRNTIIVIKDDGQGMNDKEIIQAMRPGSKHPNEKRDKSDLGRFGLGLKTSSFSQTRKFTVISKKVNNSISFWTWDLDHVNKSEKWELLRYNPVESVENEIRLLNSGTAVIWYDLDRIFSIDTKKEDESALGKFMELMETVKNHLSMVFHRFIEKNFFTLYFQGRPVAAWDPYLRGEHGTQSFPIEELENGKVKVKGYVLPHKSKLSTEKFLIAAGLKGWNAHQGFYIYRNERLLVYGEWLKMFKKEEHYKLARIIIDIPNDIDGEWQIDIKKSVARPPYYMYDQLKAYAAEVRLKAVEVYRHKGKVLQRKYPSLKYVPIWFEKQRKGKRFYAINRDHPIVKNAMDKSDSNKLNELLKFIEETVPVPLITIMESEEPESHGIAFEGANHDALQLKMQELFDQLKQQGKNNEEAAAILMAIEPFDKYPQYIDSLYYD